jgi:hypothetical protein
MLVQGLGRLSSLQSSLNFYVPLGLRVVYFTINNNSRSTIKLINTFFLCQSLTCIVNCYVQANVLPGVVILST